MLFEAAPDPNIHSAIQSESKSLMTSWGCKNHPTCIHTTRIILFLHHSHYKRAHTHTHKWGNIFWRNGLKNVLQSYYLVRLIHYNWYLKWYPLSQGWHNLRNGLFSSGNTLLVCNLNTIICFVNEFRIRIVRNLPSWNKYGLTFFLPSRTMDFISLTFFCLKLQCSVSHIVNDKTN